MTPQMDSRVLNYLCQGGARKFTFRHFVILKIFKASCLSAVNLLWFTLLCPHYSSALGGGMPNKEPSRHRS